MSKGKDFPFVSPNTLLSKAIVEISNKRLGIVTVVDKKKLKGVFTDGDLRRTIGSKKYIHRTKISLVMSKKCQNNTTIFFGIKSYRDNGEKQYLRINCSGL